MDAKIKIYRGLDAVDAKIFREMLNSEAWQLYESRLKEVLEAQRKRLEDIREPEEFHRQQGAIHMLRSVLEVPKSLLAQIKPESK